MRLRRRDGATRVRPGIKAKTARAIEQITGTAILESVHTSITPSVPAPDAPGVKRHALGWLWQAAGVLVACSVLAAGIPWVRSVIPAPGPEEMPATADQPVAAGPLRDLSPGLAALPWRRDAQHPRTALALETGAVMVSRKSHSGLARGPRSGFAFVTVASVPWQRSLEDALPHIPRRLLPLPAVVPWARDAARAPMVPTGVLHAISPVASSPWLRDVSRPRPVRLPLAQVPNWKLVK